MRIFATAFLSLIYSSLFSQQATLKLKFSAAKENNVTLQLPLDGTTFYPSRISKQFDKDSSLTVSIPVDKLANVFIINSNKTFHFLVEPGETRIDFDLKQKGSKAIAVSGPNAEGQKALNELNKEFYQYRASRFYKLDSTAKGVVALIDSAERKELLPFEALFAQKKISSTFFKAVTTDVKFNYLAIKTAVPIQIYFDSERPNAKVIFTPEFQQLWQELYKNHPFTDESELNSSNFYDHAQYYSNYYVGMYQQQQKGTWNNPDWSDRNAILSRYYQGFADNFKGKIREYLMASFLFFEMSQKEYQPVLVKLYENFKAQYPNSKYSSHLKTNVDEIIKYNEYKKKDFAADQIIIADYSQVNSLAELSAKFKGQTVFVDIWATWCGPCKEEFAYNAALEKFMKSKGVTMLFISMDKDAVDQQWKDMIKYYQLAGHHIRTNKNLQQDLMNILWDGKGYSIPRYLILKDGKLVQANALRPSDKDQLYQQISSFL